MDFGLFILILIIIRLVELWVARRNEAWIRAQGGVEYGREQYVFMVAMHTAFIASVMIEYVGVGMPNTNYFFLLLFVALMGTKVWVISALGKYWNTKIFRIPNSKPVVSGAYQYIKHPNYVIVVLEIATIPLIYHLYTTAVLFTALNAIMLTVRIKEENKVWAMKGDEGEMA